MPLARNESFSAANRLRKSSDFQKVFSRGRRTATDCFVIFTLPNDLSASRLGIQVKARIASAVRRNYIKRIVRESFRKMKGELSGAIDIIFIAKAGMTQLSHSELDVQLRRTLKKYLRS